MNGSSGHHHRPAAPAAAHAQPSSHMTGAPAVAHRGGPLHPPDQTHAPHGRWYASDLAGVLRPPLFPRMEHGPMSTSALYEHARLGHFGGHFQVPPNSTGGQSSHSTVASQHSSPHLLAPYLYPHIPSLSTYSHSYGSLSGGRPPNLIHETSPLMGTSTLPRYRHYLSPSPPGPSRFAHPQPPTCTACSLERSLSESESFPRFARGLHLPSSVQRLPYRGFRHKTDPLAAVFPFHSHPLEPKLPQLARGGPLGVRERSHHPPGAPGPYYPTHFMRGTVIQLANGDLKRVEDLTTEDFIRSAHLSQELKMDSSTVVRIEEKSSDIIILSFSVGELRVQVSVEAMREHPFFVIGQGWSSCNPERSLRVYGLSCQKLQVGDVCISLTHRDPGGPNISSHITLPGGGLPPKPPPSSEGSGSPPASFRPIPPAIPPDRKLVLGQKRSAVTPPAQVTNAMMLSETPGQPAPPIQRPTTAQARLLYALDSAPPPAKRRRWSFS